MRRTLHALAVAGSLFLAGCANRPTGEIPPTAPEKRTARPTHLSTPPTNPGQRPQPATLTVKRASLIMRQLEEHWRLVEAKRTTTTAVQWLALRLKISEQEA